MLDRRRRGIWIPKFPVRVRGVLRARVFEGWPEECDDQSIINGTYSKGENAEKFYRNIQSINFFILESNFNIFLELFRTNRLKIV